MRQMRDLLELTMYTFGDLPTAEAWMEEPNAWLGETPARAWAQPGGLERVRQLLQAIAHGTEP